MSEENDNNFETFHFNIQGTAVSIKAQKGPMGQLIVPLDKPIPGVACIFQRDEFLETIQSLLPKRLDGNILEEVKQSLFNTIQNHFNKYGGISQADMDGYISRTILVMRSISPLVKMAPISREDGIQIFAHFERMIIDAIPD